MFLGSGFVSDVSKFRVFVLGLGFSEDVFLVWGLCF